MTLGELANVLKFKVDQNSVNEVNNTVQNIKNTATKVLGAIGIGISLNELNNVVEEFGRIKDQIRNSTEGLGEQAELQEKILEAATLTRTTYEQTAGVIADLVKGNSELFGTIDEAVEFNNAATMLFKTAGKTNAQVAQMMEAINKSFQKGYVDSETLSQLLENAPEAVELLNRELGTTSDQLEQMASNGQFTVKQLKDAFTNASTEIAAKFNNVSLRISDAITYCKNKFGFWLSSFDEALGLTDYLARMAIACFNVIMAGLKKVGDGITWVVDKLGGIQNAITLIIILVSLLNANKIYNTIGNILGIVKNVAGALAAIKPKALIIIALLTLLFLVIEDFYHFMQGHDSLMGEMLERAGIDCDEFREKITETFQNIVDFVLPMWEGFVDAFKEIGGKMVEFWKEHGNEILAGFGEAISKIGEAIYKFVEWVTGAENAEEVMYNIGKAAGYMAASLIVLKPLLDIGSKVATIFSAFKKTKTATDTATTALTVVGSAAKKNGGIVDAIFNLLGGSSTKLGRLFGLLASKVTILFDAVKNKSSVLTTLKALFPTLAAKIQQFVSKFASIKNVFNGIKSAGSIGAFIHQLVTNIVTKFGTLYPEMSGIVTKVLGVLEKIKRSGGLSNYIYIQIQNLVSKSKNLIPALKGIFSKMGSSIMPAIKTVFGKIGTAIKGLFSGGSITKLFSGLGTKVAGLGSKIVAAIKALFTGLGGAAGTVNAPVLAIIAIISVLILLVPVIIKNWDKIKAFFTQLWDSIKEKFSSALEKIKSTCSEKFSAVREKISEIWTNIKDKASEIWSNITGYLSQKWEEIKSKASQIFTDIWNKIKEIFSNIVSSISEKMQDIYTAVVDGFQKAIDWIKALPAQALQWGRDIIDNIVNGIKEKISSVVEAVSGIATTIKSYIGFSEPETGPLSDFHTYMPDMIDLMVDGINGGEDAVADAVSELSENLQGIIETGTETMEALLEVTNSGMENVAATVNSGFSTLKSTVTTVLGNLKTAVSTTFTNMGTSANTAISRLKTNVQNGMNSIATWMDNNFVPKGTTWGQDIIDNMVTGINSRMDKLEKALQNAAQLIQNYIGFSEPDEGPLSDFHTYMPDMIDLMVKGISDGKTKVREAMESLSGEMSVVAQAQYVAPTTAVTATGGYSVVKNIVQYNSFSNQFNGDKVIQREASNTMKQSAKDVTAELARGLNFT